MQQLSFTCQLWEAITDPVGETVSPLSIPKLGDPWDFLISLVGSHHFLTP